MKAYQLAQAEVGTVEWRDGNNPKVVAYFKDSGNAGVRDDETAWCAAFVGAMLKRAGMKGTGKLNARSYLDWGKPVARADAKPGDIVVFKRGNSSWQGHVAFFVKDRGGVIDVLGGNQSDAVNIKGYQAAALLGIRRASTVAITAPPVSGVKPAPRPTAAPQAPASPVPATPAAPTATKPLLGAALVAAGAALWAKWGEITSWFASIFN